MKMAAKQQLIPLGSPVAAFSLRRVAGRAPNIRQQHHCQSLIGRRRLTSCVDNVAIKTCPLQFDHLQDVVIVGGGISGLSTALAFHRLGIKPLLLEQAEQLRTAGSTLVIWTNAWKALEALGVADGIRKTCNKLSGVEFLGEDGTSLASLGFDKVSRDFEVRGVERKTLLKILREALPDGTAFYDSRVIHIKKLPGGFTEVQCENGQTIKTKVLLGCDGIGSVVAKWMSMDEPRYVGYTVTRGLGIYPHGHNLHNKSRQILGRGVRAGIVPMDANRVYWFVVFNSSGVRVTDVKLIREEALSNVKGWPSMITEAINKSPPDSLSRRGISDRWMSPVGQPPLHKSGVTLAGDAMHPITPNLAQGGCLALEDAIVLARMLSKALSLNDSQSINRSTESQHKEIERIEFALKSYTEERWPRVLSIGIRSYMLGALFQLDSELMCSIRNELLPKIMNIDRFAGHTLYDCGTLE